MHLVLRQPQGPGDVGLCARRRLAAQPHLEALAIALPLGHTSARLHGHGQQTRHSQIRTGHHSHLPLRLSMGVRHLVHHTGARVISHLRRQSLERHLHQQGGLLRGGSVLRQHHGHGLPHMFDPGSGQQGHGHVLQGRPQRIHTRGDNACDIAGLPNGHHARQVECRAGIHFQHLCMRMVAAHKGHMQGLVRCGVLHIKPQTADQGFVVTHGVGH